MSTQNGSSSAIPPPPGPPPPLNENSNRRRPDPAELLALYEAKGLNPTEAAHQAINDLQKALSTVVSELRSRPGARLPRIASSSSSSAGLDKIHRRLSIIEMKLDSKPGMPEMLALQVSASALVQAAPHVFKAISDIWTSFRNSTK